MTRDTLFPRTSYSLFVKIRDMDVDEARDEWVRFWDAYAPAIRRLAAMKGGEANAEDILVVVLNKLGGAIREGKFCPQRGRLHAYIAAMIENESRMLHRRAVARGQDCQVSLDASPEDGVSLTDTLVARDAPEADYDRDWRKAILDSACEYVFTKTSLSKRDREVYQALVFKERPLEEVAAEYGITRNNASQIRARISRRIVEIGQTLVRNMVV